jgi:hypothetical protein
MDFCTQYPQLTPRDQARFKTVVARLWSGDVIMPGSPMKPYPDWTFVERYHPLVASYLALGDWELQLRQKPAMARAIHPSGKLRATFNKFQSIVTLVLRLAFHEQMGQSYDREECTITVAELRDRLHQEGLPLHQLSGRKLRDTLRLLHRHRIVDMPWGFRGIDDEQVVISPVIEAVLPDNITAYREKLTQYASPRSTESQGDDDETERAVYTEGRYALDESDDDDDEDEDDADDDVRAEREEVLDG